MAGGGKSPTVRLSADTAGKHKDKHPDLDPGDYARVQRILDEGELFADRRDPRAIVGFTEEAGRAWRTVVKSTSDGAKTYLLTLHRDASRRISAARRRLKRIDREGE